jgi:RNA polymerase sigma-70 factor (ECF subfamily)
MENAVRLSSADADAVGDEVELVRRAAFEASAFAELYQRYLARVYRYLRVRSVNNEEAADLTQQVFLKASEALPRYRQRGAPFSAWLFRIARNAATDTRRHRRDAVSLDSIVENMAPDDVEAAVLDREAHLRLRVILKELPGD